MTCRHPRDARAIERERCWSGCITPRNCHPAAHGGITYTVRCTACGATTTESINGRHSESTGWMREVQR